MKNSNSPPTRMCRVVQLFKKLLYHGQKFAFLLNIYVSFILTSMWPEKIGLICFFIFSNKYKLFKKCFWASWDIPRPPEFRGASQIAVQHSVGGDDGAPFVEFKLRRVKTVLFGFVTNKK